MALQIKQEKNRKLCFGEENLKLLHEIEMIE